MRASPAPIVPAFVVHDLGHARAVFAAAAATGRAVRVDSAPGAAGYAGAGWWAAVIAHARAEYPEAKVTAVLDCGAEAGRALGAIRAGVDAIRSTAPAPARARLKALAGAAGVGFAGAARGTALDLAAEADAGAAVARHLAPKPREKARPGALPKRRPSVISGGKKRPRKSTAAGGKRQNRKNHRKTP